MRFVGSKYKTANDSQNMYDCCKYVNMFRKKSCLG